MVSFPLACFPCFITRVVHNNSLESRSSAETEQRPISIAVKFVVRKNERLREVARQLIARIGRGYSSNVGAVKSLQWDASGGQILLLGHGAEGTFPETVQPKQVPAVFTKGATIAGLQRYRYWLWHDRR